MFEILTLVILRKVYDFLFSKMHGVKICKIGVN